MAMGKNDKNGIGNLANYRNRCSLGKEILNTFLCNLFISKQYGQKQSAIPVIREITKEILKQTPIGISKHIQWYSMVNTSLLSGTKHV